MVDASWTRCLSVSVCEGEGTNLDDFQKFKPQGSGKLFTYYHSVLLLKVRMRLEMNTWFDFKRTVSELIKAAIVFRLNVMWRARLGIPIRILNLFCNPTLDKRLTMIMILNLTWICSPHAVCVPARELKKCICWLECLWMCVCVCYHLVD